MLDSMFKNVWGGAFATTLLIGTVGCAPAAEDGSESFQQTYSEDLDTMRASVEAAVEEAGYAPLSALPKLERRSSSQPSTKIRNGTVIDYDTWPANATVLLVMNGGRHRCTAQVINQHFLLSAAHCMSPIENGGDVQIFFADDDGEEAVRIYSGPAIGAKQPNSGSPDRDVALVWLQNGMSSCEWSSAWCSVNEPNIPVNAFFRYFVPGHPLPAQSSYRLFGWGPTGEDNSYWLRTAEMPPLSWWPPTFNAESNGASLRLSWASDSDPRACQGDSGSGLEAGNADAPFYMGILSQGNRACTASTGTVLYTLVTEHQMGWVYWVMENIRIAYGLPFQCAVGELDGKSALRCDNTGSVY